jgi:negative regulator of flagellin synthesis FlgM
MRFTQPDTFLCQAIWLGLYHPSGQALTVVSAVANGSGSRFCDTAFLYCDTCTIEPPGNILCRSVSADLRPLVRRRFEMQVHGLTQLHGAQNINAPHFNRTTPAADAGSTSSINTTDELQLSPAAQMAGKLSEIPDIRWDRVNSIRSAIADGTYMTDDKMNLALDRLLDEIA